MDQGLLYSIDIDYILLCSEEWPCPSLKIHIRVKEGAPVLSPRVELRWTADRLLMRLSHTRISVRNTPSI